MVRYQIILAYDGTAFYGFQRQSKQRTVQSVVEMALQRIGWQGQTILAAGRTDTGVHAAGQVIAFDLDWAHSPDDLLRALNFNLPSDVAVREVHQAPVDFHPRYDALSRCYCYRLYCQSQRDPLRDRFAWQVWPAAAMEAMQAAAHSLIGRHDFAAFGTPPRAGGSSVRSIFQADWLKEGADLLFRVAADAFLYHMVRRLVYLLVAVGQGRLSTERLAACVQDPALASQTLPPGLAPACGLVLADVCYLPNLGRRGTKLESE